ncbi:hypothetical protein [Streptococcus ovuberis]|uniref:Uncharacterized protein n=1 Tax=Streptococcus ovuberis TaxID=1936207 RepID=A0A7X6MXX3_9STRE|nr:hypothetical protein [Streptococcus ovuberis]NKZ19406.1 hypothetical protein [Streptococcus ovuberis]
MLSFIWFILILMFPFHLLTILLMGIASYQQWSRRWQLSIALIGMLVSLAQLQPIFYLGLYGFACLALGYLISFLIGKIRRCYWRYLLSVLSVLMTPAVVYLGTALAVVLLTIGQWSYGYADVVYQGQAYTIVYTHKTSGFLFSENQALTEYLYRKNTLSPIGERQATISYDPSYAHDNLQFQLPESAELAGYLDSFTDLDENLENQ